MWCGVVTLGSPGGGCIVRAPVRLLVHTQPIVQVRRAFVYVCMSTLTFMSRIQAGLSTQQVSGWSHLVNICAFSEGRPGRGPCTALMQGCLNPALLRVLRRTNNTNLALDGVPPVCHTYLVQPFFCRRAPTLPTTLTFDKQLLLFPSQPKEGRSFGYVLASILEGPAAVLGGPKL